MKIYIPLILSGLPILPVTFDAIRQGALLFVCLVVVAIAAVGTLICSRFGYVKTWPACLFFAVGVFLMEMYYFVSWYIQHSGSSAEAGQGLIIALIEGVSITLMGCVAISVTVSFLYRFKRP